MIHWNDMDICNSNKSEYLMKVTHISIIHFHNLQPILEFVIYLLYYK